MSIEVWHFPKSATKAQLVAFLKSLGYKRGENLFFPGPKGTSHFFWSEPRDFLSSSGVDASIVPVDAEDKKTWRTVADWALHTRTSISASSHDQHFQNTTIRLARKAFGGAFYNDHFGHNRYNVVPPDKSTAPSRGITAALNRVLQDLRAVEYVLPKESVTALGTPQGAITDENDHGGLLQFTKQFDPSRVLYNALLPFLVAAVECVFRETFEILVKYDKTAQAVLEAQSRKVSFADAAALSRGDLSLERIASDWYSFQNLDSIQKAFKEVLAIDVWKAIRKRRKIRRRVPVLSESLGELIGARHGVVHKFSLDRELDRDGFLQLLGLVRTLIDVVSKEVGTKLGIDIEIEM